MALFIKTNKIHVHVFNSKIFKKKDELQDVKLTPVSGVADILPISFVMIYQIKLHSFVLFKAMIAYMILNATPHAAVISMIVALIV